MRPPFVGPLAALSSRRHVQGEDGGLSSPQIGQVGRVAAQRAQPLERTLLMSAGEPL
jgi:hypothetical protein